MVRHHKPLDLNQAVFFSNKLKIFFQKNKLGLIQIELKTNLNIITNIINSDQGPNALFKSNYFPPKFNILILHFYSRDNYLP